MECRSSVILSADVPNSGRLVGENAETTVQTFTDYHEAIVSFIQQHRGQVVDSTGDNLLAEFASGVEAVQCAVDIQREIKERNATLPDQRKMALRIGINLGDVIVKDARLHGDEVNIAVYLKRLVEREGICISGTVYHQVKDNLAFRYDYLGEQTVKNIAKPVQVYRVQMEPEATIHRIHGAQKRTILIVEDDPTWQNSLTSLLDHAGFNVTNAFDYSDALNQLRRSHLLPDLAIVDLNLLSSVQQETYDGFPVLTALRDRGIYAIIVSGYARYAVDSISARPEVYDVVDKMRFTDENFIEHFMAKVNGAIAYAEADHQAEGKMLEQQERLRSITLLPQERN
jgi:class 3 adenylate cyclase/CheY-like chemotaxis protein